MATTVGLLITVQILDQIPQLDALQAYFFSHYWLSFADLMREPVYRDDLVGRTPASRPLGGGVRLVASGAVFTAKPTSPRRHRASRRRYWPHVAGHGVHRSYRKRASGAPARRRFGARQASVSSDVTGPPLLPSSTPPKRMPM